MSLLKLIITQCFKSLWSGGFHESLGALLVLLTAPISIPFMYYALKDKKNVS